VIDLVLATVGRSEEPARLLRSLEAQTYRAFRLIVVDQNEDRRLDEVLERFAGTVPIIRLRSEPGNSRARNVGLTHVRAEVVAFPDDDCWYPPDLLHRAAECLSTQPALDGVSGRSVDEGGRPSGGRWSRRRGVVTRFNVWSRVSAYTVFLRRSAIEAAGVFDETLGLGPEATWPAAEDLDFVLRAVQSGSVILYDPDLCIHHPQRREGLQAPSPETGFRYGAGFGRVLRKNGLPEWFAAYTVVRSVGAAVLSILRREPGRARFYVAVARGRLSGWRSASTSS